jgi:hypothetical protein
MSFLVDFQSQAGPGDRSLKNNEFEGYQPVSRIGEVVMNAFGAQRPVSPRSVAYVLTVC